MARLILDTGVLVDAYRGRLNLAAIAGSDNAAVPAVVVAEYLHGVLLTPDPDRAERQRTFLQEALNFAPVLDYTHEVADEHAALLAHVQRTGTPRGAHDLIIAATARAAERIVLTTDSRALFGDLPDVHARLATA
ncbi:MAG: PIN domain-containing protein [Pseudonocardiaceae bacterium]|nr:PIN domain-containing protein [Pseudonocardiaceae bacterium]